MHRRSLIQGALAACLPCRAAAGTGRGAWQAWCDRFLQPDGRVVDDGQGGISHSEGQGYGLLLAQAHGDRAAFARIEGWTRANLAIRQDHLMGWRWEPGRGVTDWHNASDGDLFRAWALLRAARDSGWQDLTPALEPLVADLTALCLAADPRAPQEVLLAPGAELQRAPDALLVNPSYFLSRALRELGAATQRPQLVRAADHGETLLADLAGQGWLPDWLLLTPDGARPSPDHADQWGYDALRIPLYLVWSGRGDHPAVATARAMLQASRLPDHVAVVRGRDGQVLADSDLPGFRALLALCEGRALTPGPTDMDDQPYYPATVHLLTELALREG